MTRRIYKLEHPIETIVREAGSETEKTITITELALAPRVKGRHLRATDKANGAVEAKLLLIASLAGIARMEADELDEADIMAIDALYADDNGESAESEGGGIAKLPLEAGSSDKDASRSADGLPTGAASPAT